MAKITVIGDAVVVESALTLEDIKTVAKFRPEELVLMKDGEEKEPLFAIGVTNGAGNINEVGASFGCVSNDGSGLATITIAKTNGQDEDVKEWVFERINKSIIYLNRLEAKLPAILEAIKAEKNEVMSNITIA